MAPASRVDAAARGELRARLFLQQGDFTLDAQLALPTRGVTALFGPSGSGKSTLLRCVAGLVRAPEGYLEIDGEVWQDAARGHFLPTHKRSLGYVFQEASLFPHLTVEGNLAYGRRRAAAGALRVDRAHMLELLGIGHLLGRRPDRLSGGERQRVAIARALYAGPKILLLDEPLSALDHARKQEILPYLERLHDELEIPMLYVSHAPDEVARLADHLVVLEAGRVLASGLLTETLARLDLPIRLGDDAGVVLEGRVVEHDAAWHLARIDFGGGGLWLRDTGLPVGREVRVRILARDVSLALAPHDDTSILNILPVTVAALAPDAHPAQALVQLDAGGTPVLARLTQRSAAALGLRAGLRLWAQIKTAALIG